MSHMPGMRNFPVPSMMRTPAGMTTLSLGPTALIRRPEISTVAFDAGALVMSFTDTWVIAMIPSGLGTGLPSGWHAAISTGTRQPNTTTLALREAIKRDESMGGL